MYQQVIPPVYAAMEEITVIVPRRGINDDGKGKKYALQKLITEAHTEYVWLQDDDVVFALDAPVPNLQDEPDLLILPLRMAAGTGSLLAKLQQTEYAAIQSLTVYAAERGHAVMCSGANMVVRRQRWLESAKDLHWEIPSGDDMFLLESFKRRGLHIKVAYAPVAEIAPAPTLRALLHQRMRWAGKAPRYTDRDILLCGALTLVFNLLAWLPPVFLVKYLTDCLLIHRARRFGFVVRHYMGYAFLLSLVYPIYLLVCLIGGLFRQKQW